MLYCFELCLKKCEFSSSEVCVYRGSQLSFFGLKLHYKLKRRPNCSCCESLILSEMSWDLLWEDIQPEVQSFRNNLDLELINFRDGHHKVLLKSALFLWMGRNYKVIVKKSPRNQTTKLSAPCPPHTSKHVSAPTPLSLRLRQEVALSSELSISWHWCKSLKFTFCLHFCLCKVPDLL